MQVSLLDLTQLYYKLQCIILQFTCWPNTYLCQTVFRIHGHKTEMPVYSEIDLQLEIQCFSISTHSVQRLCGKDRENADRTDAVLGSTKICTLHQRLIPVCVFLFIQNFCTPLFGGAPYKHIFLSCNPTGMTDEFSQYLLKVQVFFQ